MDEHLSWVVMLADGSVISEADPCDDETVQRLDGHHVWACVCDIPLGECAHIQHFDAWHGQITDLALVGMDVHFDTTDAHPMFIRRRVLTDVLHGGGLDPSRGSTWIGFRDRVSKAERFIAVYADGRVEDKASLDED